MSRHFTMLDFMQCRTVYTLGKPLPAEDVLTGDVVDAGRRLCAELLEPLVERHGPCSVSSGWRPPVVAPASFRTPHRWGVKG